MAKGMKIAKYDALNNEQRDQSDGPLKSISVPISTTTYGTFNLSGVLGTDTTNITVLVLGVGFKDVNGVYYDDGVATSQAGAKQFNVMSPSNGMTTLTRAVLTPVSSGTLVAKQCHIRAATPTGDLFHASRITNNYVWQGTGTNTTRYRYATVSDAARTAVNANRGIGIVSAFTATNTYALVRGQ
jgi:hypothetical protein